MKRWSLFLQTLSLLHHFVGLYSLKRRFLAARRPMTHAPHERGRPVWTGLSAGLAILPARFDYVMQLPSDRTEVTIAATAAHDDATVKITPADANTTTDGHQVTTSQYPSSQVAAPEVTIRVTRGDDSETYMIDTLVLSLNNNGFAFMGMGTASRASLELSRRHIGCL